MTIETYYERHTPTELMQARRELIANLGLRHQGECTDHANGWFRIKMDHGGIRRCRRAELIANLHDLERRRHARDTDIARMRAEAAERDYWEARGVTTGVRWARDCYYATVLGVLEQP